jgi:hypothetical protein
MIAASYHLHRNDVLSRWADAAHPPGCPFKEGLVGLALLTGLGSGAVHAVSGPDHVLSLAPLSVGRRRGAWRVGLTWGLGHALGTLLSALVLVFAAEAVDLHGVEA